MIDLHCHSNFSDGTLTPHALLERAIASGITIWALTDHDTVEGVKTLQAEKNKHPITIIDGIELSVRWKKYDIHVLGLNINPDSPTLLELIERQNASRLTRSLEMSERIALLGIDNAYEKACEIAGHKRVGRPHFAKVFMDEGKVTDMQAAFKRFLGRGKPAYVPTPWISITEAVEGINQAGGQAIVAHPMKYGLTRTKLHELVSEFKLAGGAGLEVVSGEMTTTQVQDMAGLCMRFGLSASTGSDFHSDNVSRISLGRQRQLPLNCTPVWNQWNI